jgi:hypothetical protein
MTISTFMTVSFVCFVCGHWMKRHLAPVREKLLSRYCCGWSYLVRFRATARRFSLVLRRKPMSTAFRRKWQDRDRKSMTVQLNCGTCLPQKGCSKTKVRIAEGSPSSRRRAAEILPACIERWRAGMMLPVPA